MAILDVIQATDVFQVLSIDQLGKIASIAREETYEAGRYIFRQGDQARSLYVLEEGKIILEMRIARHGERGPSPPATVAVITEGEFFGWSALVDPRTLTLSGHAIDRCKVIAIDGTQLLGLMDSDPIMGYKIMRRLSEVISSRLTQTGQMLISERGLAILSEYYRY